MKPNKLQVTLKTVEREQLEILYKNAVMLYGMRKVSRARIIGALIMNCRDPIEVRRERCKQLQREIMVMQDEIKVFEEKEMEGQL